MRRWRLARAYLAQASYVVRPYDMVADRRRWRWQHPARCGRQVWADLDESTRAAILAAVRAKLRD